MQMIFETLLSVSVHLYTHKGDGGRNEQWEIRKTGVGEMKGEGRAEGDKVPREKRK